MERILPPEVEEALANIIRAHGYWPGEHPHLEIDLLDHLVHLYRIQNRHLENSVPFEYVVQSDISRDSGVTTVFSPGRFSDEGSGTPAVVLQPPLLVFLLLDYPFGSRVLDQITHFVDRIWDDLSVLDFKRTQTGVVRCYTNTRFAANALRDYGLMKFTTREKFKTWRLSLTGILVAVEVVHRFGWSLRKPSSVDLVRVHDGITGAVRDVHGFHGVVERLVELCEPKADFYRHFADFLAVLESSVAQYNATLHRDDLSADERRKRCGAIVDNLEEHPSAENFHHQLAMSLRTEEIERRLKAPR